MVNNIINEKERMFNFLKKGFFPTSIIFSKLSSYLKTIENKDCFLIVSRSAYNNKEEELKNTLHFTDEDVFFLTGEPKDSSLLECKNKLSQKKYTFILALGGGSVLDLAKAIKQESKLPLVVAPTTPGTGSEVTGFSVLTTENKEKRVIYSYQLMPEVVVLDPTLLESLPEEKLKYMIIDMFGHSLEGLFSRFSNPLSDILALNGINKIFSTVNNKDDKYLEKIQIAGLVSGMAQGMASTGLAHAFAHYFGPRYNIPHGKVLSIFLRDVVKLNLQNSQVKDKLDAQLKETILPNIDELYQTLAIEEEKIEVGADFNMEECVNKIKRDICTMTNPFRPTDEQIGEIVKAHIKNES